MAFWTCMEKKQKEAEEEGMGTDESVEYASAECGMEQADSSEAGPIPDIGQ